LVNILPLAVEGSTPSRYEMNWIFSAFSGRQQCTAGYTQGARLAIEQHLAGACQTRSSYSAANSCGKPGATGGGSFLRVVVTVVLIAVGACTIPSQV